MAFNGSGVFVRLYNWVNDAAANIKIRADRMDAEFNGIATGLTNCVTKDGQTTVTANLPMGGFKHTGVANASSATEYAAYGQLTTALAAITLDSLSDVVLTATASGDHIYYNGTNWVNVAKTVVPIDGIKTTGTSGVILKNSAGTTVLTAGASAGTTVTCAGAVNITGALGMTGKVNTAASATGGAGLNVPHGTAPTSPTNGDFWTTTSGAFVQINGSTISLTDTGKRILQHSYSTSTTTNSTATAIPLDNTIPQSTEGAEGMTASFTPTSATAKLCIWYGAMLGSSSANTSGVLALFKDSDTDAMDTTPSLITNAGVTEVQGYYEMTAGTTSAITFKIRYGGASGTTYFNSLSGTGLYGGVAPAFIKIIEVEA